MNEHSVAHTGHLEMLLLHSRQQIWWPHGVATQSIVLEKQMMHASCTDPLDSVSSLPLPNRWFVASNAFGPGDEKLSSGATGALGAPLVEEGEPKSD